MKRLVAVLLVLVGTAAMSFAGECSIHGISYNVKDCPRCYGENRAFEGKGNNCETEYPNNQTLRNHCHRGYKGVNDSMNGK